MVEGGLELQVVDESKLPLEPTSSARTRVSGRVLLSIADMAASHLYAGSLVTLSRSSRETQSEPNFDQLDSATPTDLLEALSQLTINVEPVHAADSTSANEDQPQRVAIAEVWPAKLVEPSTAALTSLLRFNAGVSVGDRVLLRRCQVAIQDASRVVLRFTDEIPRNVSQSALASHFVDQLTGRLICEGHRVRAFYQGQLYQLDILRCNDHDRTTPATLRVFKMTSSTLIAFETSEQLITQPKPSKLASSKSPFAAIGGLEKQLAAVREVVELPLTNPELFRKLGIQPPRGVLLYGIPGTGKTLIARSIATECGATAFVINGPEIVGKYYGESEARLRQIFTDAMNAAPSVIFIDEIDAICPARDQAAQDSEKRLVGTLLTLMDNLNQYAGCTENGHVVVIGATNRVDSLDSALRRPGRFDVEIECGVPNAPQRLQILEALLHDIPHSLQPEHLFKAASSTHGFVGADLSAIIKEAALCALSRTSPEHDNEIVITAPDLFNALPRVRPSAMRELVADVPHVKWDEIGGQQEVKQRLCEAVEWPLKFPEAFVRMGIRPPKGLLLYGPPGCSKTLTAKALATESGLNFVAVKGPELFSKWVGESERAVRELFRKARLASPSIIFFDEIDALAAKRSSSGEDGASGVGDRVLSQMLLEMDGIQPLQNVIIVAATNRPDMVDPALLRPGRIDRIMYVPPPDEATRNAIFEINFRRIPCASDVDVHYLAVATEGYSGAELASVCREAGLAAMDEDTEIDKIYHRHFLSALKTVKPSITASMIQFYNEYRKKSSISSV